METHLYFFKNIIISSHSEVTGDLEGELEQ